MGTEGEYGLFINEVKKCPAILQVGIIRIRILRRRTWEELVVIVCEEENDDEKKILGEKVNIGIGKYSYRNCVNAQNARSLVTLHKKTQRSFNARQTFVM